MSATRALYNFERVRHPEQLDLYRKLDADNICMFCKSGMDIAGVPVVKVGKFWTLARNKHPYAGTTSQFLCIYHEHVLSCKSVAPEAWGEAFELFGGVLDLDACAIAMRSGNMQFTCSSVAHFHLHALTGVQGKPPDETIRMDLGYMARE